jgi:hypothetical protein
VNLLDENIIESQRQELGAHRISARQVGVDIGWKGMKDRDIIRLLHECKLPTFFTRDDDFYKRGLCHKGYCLVYLDVDDDEVASSLTPFALRPSPFALLCRQAELTSREQNPFAFSSPFALRPSPFAFQS